jgi:hypothetical protein
MRLGVSPENVGNDNKKHVKKWFFEPDLVMFFSHSNSLCIAKTFSEYL